MDLGSRLQELLEEKGITQSELAERLHLSPNAVNGYIHNRRVPDCITLANIAACLETNVDYLLGNTNIRSLPDSAGTAGEGRLLSNYRALDANGKQLLEEISQSLYLHLQ